MADIRLKHFLEAPVKHREVFCSSLIGPISLGKYLDTGLIKCVNVGGEMAPKGTFAVQSDMTSVTFKIPAAAIDIVKDSGLIFMGHSLILHELTISNDASADDSFGGFGEDDGFDGAEDDGAADDNGSAEDSGAGDTSAPTNSNKGNADTGVEGVAVVAGVALVAATAVVISRKRK